MKYLRNMLLLTVVSTFILGAVGCSDDGSGSDGDTGTDDESAVDTGTGTDGDTATHIDNGADTNTIDSDSSVGTDADMGVCSGYADSASCALGACSAEVTSCLANMDCAAIAACAALCAADPICVAGCVADNVGGAALAAPLLTCTQISCADCP